MLSPAQFFQPGTKISPCSLPRPSQSHSLASKSVLSQDKKKLFFFCHNWESLYRALAKKYILVPSTISLYSGWCNQTHLEGNIFAPFIRIFTIWWLLRYLHFYCCINCGIEEKITRENKSNQVIRRESFRLFFKYLFESFHSFKI